MRMGMSPSAQSAHELIELSVAAERASDRGGAKRGGSPAPAGSAPNPAVGGGTPNDR